MELNEEVVKKSLDWLDSLVGNSNDSEIALFTYQLLGILYDTCEELTEENEAWQKQLISTEEKSGKAYYELACEVEDLRAKVTDLQDELKCEKETNAHLCSQYMSEMHLRQQAEEMLANGMSVVKADTVRKMHHKIWLEFSDCLEEETVSIGSLRASIDQIAKEMLEGDNEASGGE